MKNLDYEILAYELLSLEDLLYEKQKKIRDSGNKRSNKVIIKGSA
jgi:hypothetical protein